MPMALLRREPNGPDFFLVGLFPGTIRDCEESPQLSAPCPGSPGAPPAHPLCALLLQALKQRQEEERTRERSLSRESPPTAQRGPPEVTLQAGAQGLAAAPLGRERQVLTMAVPHPRASGDLQPKVSGECIEQPSPYPMLGEVLGQQLTDTSLCTHAEAGPHLLGEIRKVGPSEA